MASGPPPHFAAGAHFTSDISDLATSVKHASDEILATYRWPELESLPEIKQLRSDAVSALVVLQAQVLPQVARDARTARRHLRSFQELTFEEFKLGLKGIVNELTEFVKHSDDTSRLCKQYSTWMLRQQNDVARRATELQKKAAAAAEKAEGERQSGRFYSRLAAAAGVACAFASVGALAATAVYAGQLAARAVALGLAAGGMAAPYVAEAGANLSKQADVSALQAKQLGLAASHMQQHLGPALGGLASATHALHAFFAAQSRNLTTRMKLASSSEHDRELRRQFLRMQGFAEELLQECQELERQCREAVGPLKLVAALAGTAGELQAEVFKPRLGTAA